MKLICMMLFVLSSIAGEAWAHGGGLNKDGCHNDRKNGGYHCHRGSNPAPTERHGTPTNQLAPSNHLAPAQPRNGRAFANCDEARAAGAAPVRRGQPGYGSHLDLSLIHI